jgi:predicted TIM-barrel fold metal-dependent hydrolase
VILVANSILFSAGSIRTDDYRVTPLTKAYVEFMLDQVVDPDNGIYTVLPAPYQHPDVCVDLIDRFGDEDAIAALCMVTGGPEPPLGNRKYDPIYRAAEDHDLPVIFHTGGSGLEAWHMDGYEKFIETHTLGFLTANMAHLTSLVVQGVPEKFPDLDIIFQEAGLGYVPMLMYRLDSEYLKRQSEAPLLKRRPSEYMQEFYFGTQPLEENHDFLESTINHIGPDQIMYASDYPHWDYDEPSVIDNLNFLSDKQKENILGETASRVFGI